MLIWMVSISAVSCSLIFRWAYQHQILAIEVKNFAKVMLISFNTTAVFLHDAISVVGVLAWLI